MFLAMVLTNAKRAEARAVILTVGGPGTATEMHARIDMLLLDGSSQPLSAPPATILGQIIAALEQGQRVFTASVHAATIAQVNVTRAEANKIAYISQWSIEHCD